MAELLVLRFNDTQADLVEWVSVDQFGGQLGEVSRGDLTTAAAAAAAAGRKVIALVPAFSVLRVFAEIPVRAANKLLKALPFAMEEQLAEDIEHLHFATGKRGTDNRLPVAVVQRAKMDAWLEQAEAAGFELAGLYSDADALGDIPNTTILLVESDRVFLRDTAGDVAVADLIGLDALLDLWLTRRVGDEDDAPPPVHLLVYATSDSQETLNPILEQIRPLIETLDVKVLPDGALPRLAAQSAVNPGINLLQGDYARRSDLAAYWPAWRTATILLACLLISLIGSKILQIRSLNNEADRLDTAIGQAFRYTFPEVKEIRDPRALLESKLRSMGRDPGKDSGNLFLSTLKTMATAISGSTQGKAKLQAINYRTGMMELRVLAPDVDTLDKIQKEISKSGELQVEIQSANPEGAMVLGRMQIKGAEGG